MKNKDLKKNSSFLSVANIIEEARVGGPQIRNLMVASELKKKIDVSLIFPKKYSNNLKNRCKKIGVKYISVSLSTIKKDIISIIIYILLFPFEVIILSKILKKGKFDIVHVSGGCWQCKGIFAAKLAKKKVIWELNDTYSPIIVRWIFFLLSNLADGFIFASEKTKKYYTRFIFCKKKSFLIQSPVDTKFFDPNFNYVIKKSIKKLSFKDKILIGTVANINPVKDLMTLLNIAKKLSHYSNKVIFIVMGSVYESQRKYFKYLNDRINNFQIKNFFFLSSKNDIRPFLKAIDIYTCTSKNESSPLSLWEAMSMEKAIVSTDVGDVKKFLKDNINGIIVKPNDEKALATAINKLSKNSKLRISYGRLSRQIAIKKLDLKICAQLNFNVYKNINL